MSQQIIEVKNIWKKYRLGLAKETVPPSNVLTHLLKRTRDIFLDKKTINGLRKDEFWALKNVSFSVKPGEVLGIIGRNGAGKSTILKILSRVTLPTKGEITLRGRIASLLEVGTGFNPELTGRENIFLNGTILGMTQREITTKFNDIVNFAEIHKFLDTPVKFYSSGMYMRLAFAVAAHLDPEILLVDEVLAVGDMAFQKKCLGKIEDVAQKGRTVLFVSHNMGMIRALCQHAIFIEKGQIIKRGKPDEIISLYMTYQNKENNSGKVNLLGYQRAPQYNKSIIEAWFEDIQGKTVSDILMGSPFRICFRFKASHLLHDPGFGCDVYNIFGQRVFVLTSYLIKNTRFKNVSEGTVTYTIPELPLLPGRYTVSLGVAERKIKTIDYVDMALSFNVLPHDIFSTGIPLESGHGSVFVRGDITLA